MDPEVAENIAFEMPWQLDEQLYKAHAAGNTHTIADIGLRAIAYETRTNYSHKEIDYVDVWRTALSMLVSAEF